MIGQWSVRAGSHEEIKIALVGVAHRYRLYGFRGPLLYSTDDCCHEHKLLADVFSALRDEKFPIRLEKNVPPFTLAQRVEYLRTEGAVRVLAGELQEDANNGSLYFFGLDTEYPWSKPDKKISTLQLARPGECSARRE